MDAYGPFNATLNTVVKVSGITPNADRVFLDNQSRYTLAVAFTDVAPVAASVLRGRPWYAEVPPGGKTVAIPAGSYSGTFPGYFWVMALDPLAGTRAYAGTISINVAFFVVGILPGETSLPDYGIPQSVDAASQPRVIAIPPSTTRTFSGFHTWAALENFRPADINDNGFGNSLLVAMNGNQYATFYLYRCNFTVLTAGTGQNVMVVKVEEFNSANLIDANLVAAHALHTFGWVTGGTAPYTPPLASNPVRGVFFLNAATVAIGISVANANGTSIQLSYDIGIDLGGAGTPTFPAAIGGGSNGVIFNSLGSGGPF